MQKHHDQPINIKHPEMKGKQEFLWIVSRISKNNRWVIIPTKQLEKQRPAQGRLTKAKNPSYMTGMKLGSYINYTETTS